MMNVRRSPLEIQCGVDLHLQRFFFSKQKEKNQLRIHSIIYVSPHVLECAQQNSDALTVPSYPRIYRRVETYFETLPFTLFTLSRQTQMDSQHGTHHRGILSEKYRLNNSDRNYLRTRNTNS